MRALSRVTVKFIEQQRDEDPDGARESHVEKGCEKYGQGKKNISGD